MASATSAKHIVREASLLLPNGVFGDTSRNTTNTYVESMRALIRREPRARSANARRIGDC